MFPFIRNDREWVKMAMRCDPINNHHIFISTCLLIYWIHVWMSFIHMQTFLHDSLQGCHPSNIDFLSRFWQKYILRAGSNIYVLAVIHDIIVYNRTFPYLIRIEKSIFDVIIIIFWYEILSMISTQANCMLPIGCIHIFHVSQHLFRLTNGFPADFMELLSLLALPFLRTLPQIFLFYSIHMCINHATLCTTVYWKSLSSTLLWNRSIIYSG